MRFEMILPTRGHLLVTTERKNFHYQYTQGLLKDGAMIRSKAWQEAIARDRR